MRSRRVSMAMACVLLMLCGTAGAADPSAQCPASPIEVRIGQGVPLLRTFSNPLNKSVTFTVTMLGNPVFGPPRVVQQVTLAAHRGQTSSDSPVWPTGLRTPAGPARIRYDVTTNRTGARVVTSCEFDLRLLPPADAAFAPTWERQSVTGIRPGLYQVPVRLCVVEGAVLAAGRKGGQVVGGDALVAALEQVNRDFWYSQARIGFTTSIDRDIPVIADPSPPGTTCGQLGDLRAAGPALGDGGFAETACDAQWASRYPGRPGIAVIVARDFCESGAIKGGAPPPATALMVASRKPGTGQRGDDLCGRPVRLTPADVTNANRKPFLIIIEPARNSLFPAHLAHELGHNLFLGHGNGRDDNGDGRPAGTTGPKRYDENCDPGWLLPPDNTVLAEDVSTPFVDCATSGSLMIESAGCPQLTPLQIETARGVARVMPGFKSFSQMPVGNVPDVPLAPAVTH